MSWGIKPIWAAFFFIWKCVLLAAGAAVWPWSRSALLAALPHQVQLLTPQANTTAEISAFNTIVKGSRVGAAALVSAGAHTVAKMGCQHFKRLEMYELGGGDSPLVPRAAASKHERLAGLGGLYLARTAMFVFVGVVHCKSEYRRLEGMQLQYVLA